MFNEEILFFVEIKKLKKKVFERNIQRDTEFDIRPYIGQNKAGCRSITKFDAKNPGYYNSLNRSMVLILGESEVSAWFLNYFLTSLSQVGIKWD